MAGTICETLKEMRGILIREDVGMYQIGAHGGRMKVL